MYKKLSLLLVLFASLSLSAQDRAIDYPEFHLNKEEIRTQMEFLASDFLAGRRTTSEGNRIAAEYIASHLRAYGYTSPEGADNYLQMVPFEASTPPQSYSMSINNQDFKSGDDFLIWLARLSMLRPKVYSPVTDGLTQRQSTMITLA